MQRWEYCQVLDHEGNDKGLIVFWAEDGVQREEFARDKDLGDSHSEDAARRRMAKLGDEGWELVSGGRGFLFKRPKP